MKNQYFLMEQFAEELSGVDNNIPVLFDAHMLIDNENELIEIPIEIFRGLFPSRIIYIYDDSDIIIERRNCDQSRKRPVRDRSHLDEQQGRSIQLAEQYSRELAIPCSIIKGANIDEILQAMRS